MLVLFFDGINVQECIEMSALVQSRYAKKTVPKSKKPRITFRKKVELRQSSAKDNNGDTIPNTAICTDQDHSPLLKNVFFDTLPNDILNNINIDEKSVKTKLKAALLDDISILEGAKWVISYLENKKDYLKKNQTSKVFLGSNGLQFQHIFIIEQIIEILQKIQREEEDTAPSSRCLQKIQREEEDTAPSSRCPKVGCTISYRDSIQLSF